MTYLKIFLLLITFNFSKYKKIEDYSYFLFSISNNQIYQGTGFFIKKKSQVYLVTASHNFFKDKSAKVKTAESFFIRLYEKKTKKVEFLKVSNIPISKSKRSDSLDINFYKLNIPSIYETNFVDINLTCTPSSIICFGFGVIDGNENNPNFYIKNLTPTQFKGNLKFKYSEPIRYYETNEVDYDNYVASYESGTLKQGTSGSPVFTPCLKNGVSIYEFAGLIHLRNERTKLATILKPETIKQLIEEL